MFPQHYHHPLSCNMDNVSLFLISLRSNSGSVWPFSVKIRTTNVISSLSGLQWSGGVIANFLLVLRARTLHILTQLPPVRTPCILSSFLGLEWRNSSSLNYVGYPKIWMFLPVFSAVNIARAVLRADRIRATILLRTPPVNTGKTSIYPTSTYVFYRRNQFLVFWDTL